MKKQLLAGFISLSIIGTSIMANEAIYSEPSKTYVSTLAKKICVENCDYEVDDECAPCSTNSCPAGDCTRLDRQPNGNMYNTEY